jgi:hypothetical protein
LLPNDETVAAPQNPPTIADMAKNPCVSTLCISVHPFAKLSQIFHEVALSPIPRKGGEWVQLPCKMEWCRRCLLRLRQQGTYQCSCHRK